MLTDLIFNNNNPQPKSNQQKNIYQNNSSVLYPVFKGVFGVTLSIAQYGLNLFFKRPQTKIWLGKSNNGQFASIDYNFLFYHFLVTGGTGSGKSGVLINTACQAINSPKIPQVLLLDPNTETAIKIYKRIKYTGKTKLLAIEYKKDGVEYVTGYNPLLCLDNQLIEHNIIYLQNIFFAEAVRSNNYNILNISKKVFETGLNFHLAYINYITKTGLIKDKNELETIIKNKQLTLRDLGQINESQSLFESYKNLFSTVFKGYNNSLFEFWTNEATKSQYLPNVTQRIASITCNPSVKYFFESKGYDLISFITEGFNVLCPLTGLQSNPLLKEAISKLFFTQILNYYMAKTDFETGLNTVNPLLFLIDEAKVIEFENMADIIEQARKFKIALGLYAQRPDQFTKQTQNAFQSLGTMINLRQDQFNDVLPDRSFKVLGVTNKDKDTIFKSLDYPLEVRNYLNYSQGVKKSKIRAVIEEKDESPLEYFITSLNTK